MHLGKVWILYQYYFKVGTVLLTQCCILILVVGIIIDDVFMHENTACT